MNGIGPDIVERATDIIRLQARGDLLAPHENLSERDKVHLAQAVSQIDPMRSCQKRNADVPIGGAGSAVFDARFWYDTWRALIGCPSLLGCFKLRLGFIVDRLDGPVSRRAGLRKRERWIGLAQHSI